MIKALLAQWPSGDRRREAAHTGVPHGRAQVHSKCRARGFPDNYKDTSAAARASKTLEIIKYAANIALIGNININHKLTHTVTTIVDLNHLSHTHRADVLEELGYFFFHLL